MGYLSLDEARRRLKNSGVGYRLASAREIRKQNKQRFVWKGSSSKIEDSRAKSMTSAARRILASRAALFARPSPREAKSYARYGFPSVSQTRARGVI